MLQGDDVQEVRTGGGGGADCRARCPGPRGETYCRYIAEFDAAFLLGSRGCVDKFNSLSRVAGEEARWARAFLEVRHESEFCLSYN